MTTIFKRVVGICLLSTGFLHAASASSSRWLGVAFSGFYLSSFLICVIIIVVNVQKHIVPTQTIYGLYFIASFITGVVGGALSGFFPFYSKHFTILLGGFLTGLNIQSFKNEGLITPVLFRYVFYCTFVIGLEILCVKYKSLQDRVLSFCFAISGSTCLMLGVDCFTSAGIKEAYLYSIGIDVFRYRSSSPNDHVAIVIERCLIGGCTLLSLLIQPLIQKHMPLDRLLRFRQSKKQDELINNSRRDRHRSQSSLSIHLDKAITALEATLKNQSQEESSLPSSSDGSYENAAASFSPRKTTLGAPSFMSLGGAQSPSSPPFDNRNPYQSMKLPPRMYSMQNRSVPSVYHSQQYLPQEEQHDEEEQHSLEDEEANENQAPEPPVLSIANRFMSRPAPDIMSRQQSASPAPEPKSSRSPLNRSKADYSSNGALSESPVQEHFAAPPKRFSFGLPKFDFPGAENARSSSDSPAPTPTPASAPAYEPRRHPGTVPMTSMEEARRLGASQDTLAEIEKLRASINELRSELGPAAEDIPANSSANYGDRHSRYWNDREHNVVEEEAEEEAEEEELDEWEEYLKRRQLVFPHVPRPYDPMAYIPGTFKSMSRSTLGSGESENKSSEGESHAKVDVRKVNRRATMQLYPETRQPQVYGDPRMTHMLARRNSSMSEIVEGESRRRRTRVMSEAPPPLPAQKPPTRRAMSMEELQNRHRQKLREMQEPVNKHFGKGQQPDTQQHKRSNRHRPHRSQTSPAQYDQYQQQQQQRPPRRRRQTYYYSREEAPPLPPLPATARVQ